MEFISYIPKLLHNFLNLCFISGDYFECLIGRRLGTLLTVISRISLRLIASLCNNYNLWVPRRRTNFLDFSSPAFKFVLISAVTNYCPRDEHGPHQLFLSLQAKPWSWMAHSIQTSALKFKHNCIIEAATFWYPRNNNLCDTFWYISGLTAASRTCSWNSVVISYQRTVNN